jgi:hypothetical protein
VPFAFPFSGYGVDRDFLAHLVSKHDFLDLLFDTRGIRPDRPFIVNRVFADTPPEVPTRGSNLPELTHKAYRDYVLWRRRYYLSVLRARIKG